MTLSELFKEWAKQPQFTKLAGSYRPAFTNVFLKNFADRDIQTIDKDATKEMLLMNSQPMADRIRACSTLVQILQYGCTKGYCKQPDFRYTIASVANQPAKIEEQTPEPPQPGVKVKREALERRANELIAKAQAGDKEAKKKAAKITKKVRKCNKPKAVVQLDPVTYQPIKTFANAAVAGKAVGSTNVLRAVKEHTISAGYFWAYEAGVKDFKPCNGTLKRRAIKANHMVPPGVTDAAIENVIEELDAASDRLREEQEEREAERKAKAEILAEYTNDDLLNEIRRRDWKGNVIIPINFEL